MLIIGYNLTFKVPNVIFTNGLGIFESSEGSDEKLSYQCIDQLLEASGDLAEAPIAMLCEKIKPIEPSVKKHGPKCLKSEKKQHCIPKCCPADEIFDVDSMR